MMGNIFLHIFSQCHQIFQTSYIDVNNFNKIYYLLLVYFGGYMKDSYNRLYGKVGSMMDKNLYDK